MKLTIPKYYIKDSRAFDKLIQRTFKYMESVQNLEGRIWFCGQPRPRHEVMLRYAYHPVSPMLIVDYR